MIDISVWQESVQDQCDALTGGSTVDQVIEAGIGARSVELSGGTIERTILDAQLQVKLDATTSATDAAELIALGATIPPETVAGGGSYLGEIDSFPVVNPFVAFTTADGGTWLPSGNVIPVAQAPSLAGYPRLGSVHSTGAVLSGDAQIGINTAKVFLTDGASAGILLQVNIPAGVSNTEAPRMWVTLDNGVTWANRAFAASAAPSVTGFRYLGGRWEGTGFRLFFRGVNDGVYTGFFSLATLVGGGTFNVVRVSGVVGSNESYSYYGSGVVWDGGQYIFVGLSSNGNQLWYATSSDGATFGSPITRTIAGGGLTATQVSSACTVVYTDRLIVMATYSSSQNYRATYSTDNGATFSPAYVVPGVTSTSGVSGFYNPVYEGGNVYVTVPTNSQRTVMKYDTSLTSMVPLAPALSTNVGARVSSQIARLGVGHYVVTAPGTYADTASRLYIHETLDYGNTWEMIPLGNVTPSNSANDTVLFSAARPSGVGLVLVLGSTIYTIPDFDITHVGIAEVSYSFVGVNSAPSYQCVRIE